MWMKISRGTMTARATGGKSIIERPNAIQPKKPLSMQQNPSGWVSVATVATESVQKNTCSSAT